MTCGWCQDGWPLIPNGVKYYGRVMHSVPEPMSQVPCESAREPESDLARGVRLARGGDAPVPKRGFA